jgi:hypothetical protein
MDAVKMLSHTNKHPHTHRGDVALECYQRGRRTKGCMDAYRECTRGVLRNVMLCYVGCVMLCSVLVCYVMLCYVLYVLYVIYVCVCSRAVKFVQEP